MVVIRPSFVGSGFGDRAASPFVGAGAYGFGPPGGGPPGGGGPQAAASLGGAHWFVAGGAA
jgi:hypothetical protein